VLGRSCLTSLGQICRECIPLIRSCDCQIYQNALSSLAASTLAPNSLRYLLGLAQRLSISIVRVSCCLTMTALFLMRSPVRQSSGGRWSLIEPCIQLSRPEIDCGSMLAPPGHGRMRSDTISLVTWCYWLPDVSPIPTGLTLVLPALILSGMRSHEMNIFGYCQVVHR